MKSISTLFPWKKELLLWAIALLLLLPATMPYIYHFTRQDGQIPTGFIGDQPYYMANAREYLDQGGIHLFYGNPASSDYNTPKIYFQPQTLFLALCLKITSWDPGILWLLFGFFSAWIFIRIAMALFECLVPLKSRASWICLVLFIWGGGILGLAGICYTRSLDPKGIFMFDPFGGWWRLNLGRNLLFPFEIYYHGLFFATILCLFKKYWKTALGLSFFLSISHPFTGVEFLSILFAWVVVEVYFLENRQIPKWMVLGSGLVLTFHLGYYMGYLNLFPEHRILFQTWKVSYCYQAKNFIPAYCLVGFFAFLSFQKFSIAKKYFSDFRHRLCLLWLIVAFLLSNHEFYMAPIQPLHFTRGYVWTALFLLGLPSLFRFVQKILLWKNLKSFFCATFLILLFLSDNLLWLGAHSLFPKGTEQKEWRLNRDEQKILPWLRKREKTYFAQQTLVVSLNRELSYMVTLYTSLRSLVGHSTTPNVWVKFSILKKFFNRGQAPPSWRRRNLLIICEAIQVKTIVPFLSRRRAKEVFSSGKYKIFEVPPYQ